MANIQIGEEKVTPRAVCFDDEDWDQLKETASKNGFNGVSALVRGFLRSLELHPKEIINYLEEAKEENRKIQSVGKRKEHIRSALRRTRKFGVPKPFWEK